MLKLKRKLQFRGQLYFQAVRPEVVLHALQWLKRDNELYENVAINLQNIDRELSRNKKLNQESRPVVRLELLHATVMAMFMTVGKNSWELPNKVEKTRDIVLRMET